MDSQQSAEEPVAEEMQQEPAYPPPPSYYENMQLPAELPALPEKQPPPQVVRPQPGVVLPPAGAPGPYPGPSPMGWQPYYTPAQYPGAMPPVTSSRKQTWIIIAIICASVLLLCGAGGWALSNILGAVSQQVNSANLVVQDFYQHMLHQDYTGAYADLQIKGLTTSTSTKDAQALDSQNGQISPFSLDAAPFNSSTSVSNTTHWQVTVHVTRQQASYSVSVSVDAINGSLLITAIDLNKF